MKRVVFMLEEPELREFNRHVEHLGHGATKTGVLRSILSDWMEWRRSEWARKKSQKKKEGAMR